MDIQTVLELFGIRPANFDELRQMENTNALRQVGIKLINPTVKDKAIMDAIAEVSERIGVDSPRVAVHDGHAGAVYYFANQNYLIIPRALGKFPSKELRAIIAHELDHKTKRHVTQRLGNIASGLTDTDADKNKAAYFEEAAGRISLLLELSADKRAAALYGAENMQNALVRIARTIGEDEIADTMTKAAVGVATTGMPQIDKRLRQLGGMQKPEMQKRWTERIKAERQGRESKGKDLQ